MDWDHGIRPDVITFADVGDHQQDKPGEKPETYAYIPVLRAWLKAHSFPDLTIRPPHHQARFLHDFG